MSNEDGLHPIARAYIRRLEKLGAELPRERREELVAEVTQHLAQAIPRDASDAEAQDVLENFGSAEEIVDAERGETASVAGTLPESSWREVTAIVLLLFGGFFFVFGWLVGLVLLWPSKVWTVRDKLIGTFIWPGGLVASLLVMGSKLSASSSQSCARALSSGGATSTHCNPATGSGGPSVFVDVLIVLAALAPLGTALYLALRTRRNSIRARHALV